MLVISDVTIPLGNSRSALEERSFRNVMSEGDKRTLALAFFLAQLNKMSDLSEKILVFDDPVTSLDENRELYTSEIVGVLSTKAKQVIVLSHRSDFLYRVWDHFGNGAKHAVPCKRLEIRFKENEQDSSEITTDWDIRSAVRSFHADNIRKVLDFMNGSHQYKSHYIAMLLRPIMETHFKACYPDTFTGGVRNLGDFLACIARSDAKSPLHALKGDVTIEIDLLNKYLTTSQHGGDLQPSISRNQLIPYCRRVLALVGRL